MAADQSQDATTARVRLARGHEGRPAREGEVRHRRAEHRRNGPGWGVRRRHRHHLRGSDEQRHARGVRVDEEPIG